MQYITHKEPVFRSKADFLIQIDVPQNAGGALREQLWTREIEKNLHEVCCIPFFVYNVNVLDIVRTTSENGTILFSEVVKASGWLTLRMVFADSNMAHQQEYLVELHQTGALTERSSETMVAIAVNGGQLAGDIRSWLDDLEAAGILEYETGWL